MVPLDVEGAERRYGLQSKDMKPEEVFDHRWAITMLDRAMARLQNYSVESGSESQFEVLKQYLTGLESEVPYHEAALQLEMSEGAIKTAVYRLRRRFGECLRGEVADTVVDPAEVDAEIRQLLSSVR